MIHKNFKLFEHGKDRFFGLQAVCQKKTGGSTALGFVSQYPPKFNMEPENDGFQKESPFPGTSFQIPC